MATVPVGQWPEDVVFDPESGHLFVADEGSATITVLGPAGQRVSTIRLATRARHLAVDSGLRHLY
ncbi:MAG: YncE family protein, partial [Candidatus Methylomirabilales bacterium]